MSSHSKFTSTSVRFQNRCFVSHDGVAHCQSYYERNTTFKTQNYKKQQIQTNQIKRLLKIDEEKQKVTENALSTCIGVEKKEEAPLYYRSSRVLQQQQQPALSPNVAKLFRGELLPSGPPNNYNKIIRKKLEKIKEPEHYKEQIQLCVANPGKFQASWTLLAKMFGEPKLYDYIRKNAWSKEELKNFEINDELESQ
ncbi:hypothetical protein ACQ4LE_000551 [Meloidogyne hapla]|uniref:Uncharacterized protein n=1 Tax=Meloidogyne hapla TaxID=6305 RepID=A0A1I8C2H3_MELHA